MYDYEIQCYYGSWEMVTTEETYSEAYEQLQCYRDNEPGTAFRIRKVKA